ncbi:MAG: hypothetical protein RBR71_06285 [Gudongella sp.]|jgi:predicted MFS family arabinose efflux permease|nr:hypothetical protein [Gudongella sp.]
MKTKVINRSKQVLIEVTIINFFTGMMYAWSLISKALAENHGWSSKEASILLLLLLALYYL